MSIMYQNKTYKAPSLEEEKQFKQSTCFASKKQRFMDKVVKSPGPGSYDYTSSNYKIPNYHVPKDHYDSPIKREHQWIWGSDRLSYMSSHNYSGFIGPGSYNPGANTGGTGQTNWGKSERFSLKKHDYNTAPGPGAYDNQVQPKKKGGGSAFKSRSPRSFIEKLLSESSMPQLKPNEMPQFIQNPEVPEKEEQKSPKNTENKLKLLKSSVFASKIPRFIQTQVVNQNIGPGSYDVSNLNKSRSKEQLPKIVIIKGEERKRKPIKQDPLPPGPGSYELSMKTIEKDLETKKSVVICSEPRFYEKSEKLPGPGQYLQVRKDLLRSQLQKSHKLMPEKPCFNSSAERTAPELPSKSNPLCAYNLEYFDLQYKLKKSREHLQKLKIMEVTIPAFNSKAKR